MGDLRPDAVADAGALADRRHRPDPAAAGGGRRAGPLELAPDRAPARGPATGPDRVAGRLRRRWDARPRLDRPRPRGGPARGWRPGRPGRSARPRRRGVAPA